MSSPLSFLSSRFLLSYSFLPHFPHSRRGDFFYHSSSSFFHSLCISLSFYYSIKWLFYKDLGLILAFSCCCRFIMAFGLLSSYCSVWFVVDLLRHGAFHRLITMLYLRGNIKVDKTDSISRRYIPDYVR